ncbi:MAG: SH3 domain-containing protein [Deltaproteobacteria bacterium]|nr:SH3 domain-containing protein [Deltaproteobacteria bacterium]
MKKTILSAFCRDRVYLCLVLAVLVCLITACLKQTPKQTDIPDEQAMYEKLKNKNKNLQQTLAKSNADNETLKNRNVTTQWFLLEKDEQIKELNKQISLQQKTLDEAILEVVRAKAKLRSLESKAEAASNMAETEISLKTLKARLEAAGQEHNTEFIKAEQLLILSAQEFKKENYGGALYITGQAKALIKASQVQLGTQVEIALVKDEVLFVVPLPLRVLKNSNLRVGAGRKYKSLGIIKKGALVSGYSYKSEWVRVKIEDGTYGWIFHTLVGGR